MIISKSHCGFEPLGRRWVFISLGTVPNHPSLAMKPCRLGVCPLIVSEGRHYANRWLDLRSSITFGPDFRRWIHYYHHYSYGPRWWPFRRSSCRTTSYIQKNVAAHQSAGKLVMGRVHSRRFQCLRSVPYATNQGITKRGAKSWYGRKEIQLGLEFYNFHSIY
jgi:hypothetical protein